MTYLKTSAEFLDEARARAASAYSRSNDIVDVDVLDAVTAEIADQAADLALRARRATRSGRESDLDFPFAAVADLLAAVAALRAALGYSDTPTEAEVFADNSDAEAAHTRGLDQLRLHLIAEHGYVLAPSATDREVMQAHVAEHTMEWPDFGAHHIELLTWDSDTATTVIRSLAPAGAEDQFQRAFEAIRARHEHGTEIPPGVVRA